MSPETSPAFRCQAFPVWSESKSPTVRFEVSCLTQKVCAEAVDRIQMTVIPTQMNRVLRCSDDALAYFDSCFDHCRVIFDLIDGVCMTPSGRFRVGGRCAFGPAGPGITTATSSRVLFGYNFLKMGDLISSIVWYALHRFYHLPPFNPFWEGSSEEPPRATRQNSL